MLAQLLQRGPFPSQQGYKEGQEGLCNAGLAAQGH